MKIHISWATSIITTDRNAVYFEITKDHRRLIDDNMTDHRQARNTRINTEETIFAMLDAVRVV